jgi:hypothetical protein
VGSIGAHSFTNGLDIQDDVMGIKGQLISSSDLFTFLSHKNVFWKTMPFLHPNYLN